MEFTVEDAALNPSKAKLPRAVERAVEILDALPDGKLLLGISVAERVGISYASWDKHSNHPAMRDLKVKQVYRGTVKNLYGNLATIKAYKEQAHE